MTVIETHHQIKMTWMVENPKEIKTCLSLQGNVYVKCPSIPAAMATVNALHGRWFAGMF